MSTLELSTNKNFLLPKSIIRMNNWFRNKITDLYNIVSAPIAATRDALAERLQSVRETASLFISAKKKLGYGQTLKEEVEKQAEKEHPKNQEEQDDDMDLTPEEHEEVFNGAYKRFRVAGLPKADIDTYSKKVTPHVKTLIEEQLQ